MLTLLVNVVCKEEKVLNTHKQTKNHVLSFTYTHAYAVL